MIPLLRKTVVTGLLMALGLAAAVLVRALGARSPQAVPATAPSLIVEIAR